MLLVIFPFWSPLPILAAWNFVKYLMFKQYTFLYLSYIFILHSMIFVYNLSKYNSRYIYKAIAMFHFKSFYQKCLQWHHSIPFCLKAIFLSHWLLGLHFLDIGLLCWDVFVYHFLASPNHWRTFDACTNEFWFKPYTFGIESSIKEESNGKLTYKNLSISAALHTQFWA